MRKSNSLITLPLCTNRLITHRNSHRPPRHLRGSICTRTVPPRQVLVPNRNRGCALDRLYIDCLLPPRAQPGQLTNAQLRARRSRDRPYLRPGVLGYKRPEVVHGTYQADRRCARSLLYFFFINTEDKWLACTLAEEEMGIRVAESVVISEKPEFSEKSTGP